MVDNAVPTLVPESHASGAAKAPPVTQKQSTPFNTEKETLFDSIAQESAGEEGEFQSSSAKAFFTGLLWFGYAVAIVVALVLVWSAASGLIKSLPR